MFSCADFRLQIVTAGSSCFIMIQYLKTIPPNANQSTPKMSNEFKFRTNDPLHRIQNPFGSANFLTEHEISLLSLTQQGLKNKFCPYIGIIDNTNALFARKPYVENLRNPFDTMLSWELPEGNGHLLTVAPTRAGKGTGQIIPNLLSWVGSVLVIDIKGENYLRSAGYRKEVLNQKVIRFAPFEEISEI